jgi:hypothetical protein
MSPTWQLTTLKKKQAGTGTVGKRLPEMLCSVCELETRCGNVLAPGGTCLLNWRMKPQLSIHTDIYIGASKPQLSFTGTFG